MPTSSVQSPLVKLNQNESPLDWPMELKEEVVARLAARPWNRYPPVDADALRGVLAQSLGITADLVAVTNGSNEAILALVQAFAGGKTVLVISPGYSMSAPLAVVGGAAVRTVRLLPDFSLDVPAMIDAAQAPDVGMIFLASPNNPTGNAFGRPQIEAVVEAARRLVVIDEAYASFAADSFLPDIRRYPHLAVLRTFSKGFALAGARVGWITAADAVIAAVRKAVPPYNLNVFAQEAALAALERPDLIAARVALILQERGRMFEKMRAMDGVTPYRSNANFILFRTGLAASTLFARLVQRGVLVRDVSSQPLLDRCLRVTVGTPDENERFLDALRASVETP
jgi:histidinol-phosphate aminotransferase